MDSVSVDTAAIVNLLNAQTRLVNEFFSQVDRNRELANLLNTPPPEEGEAED